MISLTTDQAIKYGIADGSAETIDALLDSLGYSTAELIETSENWSEKIVRFLTDPVVASLLTTFGFLGILFELQSPGWGIPGFVGLACLILSLSVSYIAELATMSDMLFVFAGLGLILLEMLVIPGFGIVGLGGIGFMLYGLYLLLLPDVPVGEEIMEQAMDGFIIGLIGAAIGLVLLIRLMMKTKFWDQHMMFMMSMERAHCARIAQKCFVLLVHDEQREAHCARTAQTVFVSLAQDEHRKSSQS